SSSRPRPSATSSRSSRSTSSARAASTTTAASTCPSARSKARCAPTKATGSSAACRASTTPASRTSSPPPTSASTTSPEHTAGARLTVSPDPARPSGADHDTPHAPHGAAVTTTATHLRTIALHWTDLHEALGEPAQLGAFGLGLRGYLARLDAADAEQLEYERHQAAHLRSLERDPIQLGTRPVPIRLHILDTMRTVEAALVACADDIAAAAQRAPITVPAARKADYRSLREARIAAAERQRQQQLAHAD